MADQTPNANAGKDVTDFDALTATKYVVLRQEMAGDPARGSWHEVTSAAASSAEGAIRAVVGKLTEKDQAGTFVAVPARSWKPVTVNPQTTIRLELTEAKP